MGGQPSLVRLTPDDGLVPLLVMTTSPHTVKEYSSLSLPEGRAADGIRGLRVLGDVQAGHLVLFFNSQSHDGIQDFQQDERDHETQHPSGDNADYLVPELSGIAIEKAVRTGRINGLRREQASGDGPPRASDAVHSYDIQRVVVTELGFQIAGIVTEEPGHRSNEDGCQGANIP